MRSLKELQEFKAKLLKEKKEEEAKFDPYTSLAVTLAYINALDIGIEQVNREIEKNSKIKIINPEVK